MLRISSLIIIVVLTLLMLIYFYHHFFTYKPTQQKQIPNIIITDVNFMKMNKQGQPLYHFLSQKLYHYDKKNRSEFIFPIGYYYPEQQAEWKLTADHGQALNGNTIVYLLGHVNIHQNASKNNKSTTLITSKVTIYPKRQIAENDVPVTVKQPGITVTSIGFHANLQKGEVTLLSKTKGYFVSQQTSH